MTLQIHLCDNDCSGSWVNESHSSSVYADECESQDDIIIFSFIRRWQFQRYSLGRKLVYNVNDLNLNFFINS